MSRIFSIPVMLWQRLMPLRFVVVGGWNTIFSYLVFTGLYYVLGGSVSGDVAVQVITAIVGITNAYVLHRILTYRSNGIWWREYLRFYVVYGSQITLQAVCFFIFSTWLGWNGYIVQLVLTALFTVLSYWAHKVYSFKRANHAGEGEEK